jgi:endo-1,4-beta-xylanase
MSCARPGMVDRRAFLGGMAAAGLAAGVLPPPSFGAGAARRPTLFGSAVNPRLLHENDHTYASALARHCRIVVPEGGLKWAGLRPSPTTFDFYLGDLVSRLAGTHGMEMRGHTLVWHAAMPAWTREIVTARQAEQALALHIGRVVRHYRGRISSWDVVNEPLPEDPGPPEELRQTLLQRALGDGYIELALHMAAAADPAMELVINEYDLEFAGERFGRKRAAMLHLLERIARSGAPLHALGLQAHLRGERDVDRAGLRHLIRQVQGMGLGIVVTELDVMDYALPAEVAARDAAVAARVQELLDVVFEECTPKAVLTWGLTDCHAWIPDYARRRDGHANRPLPLDADYAEKPFMKVLRSFGA